MEEYLQRAELIKKTKLSGLEPSQIPKLGPKEEEKKDDEKEDVNEVTEATEKKPRFSFLTKFFKRDAVADKNVEAPEEMPVKMADCQSVEKEGEEQKTEEFVRFDHVIKKEKNGTFF